MARILVADDQLAVRKLIRIILEREGHEVLEASTGRRAIECFERNECDAAFLDLMMPDMSGYEVLDYLRNHHPESLKCLVVVTAMSDQELDQKLGTDRPFKLVKKPFDIETIAAAVDDCLR